MIYRCAALYPLDDSSAAEARLRAIDPNYRHGGPRDHCSRTLKPGTGPEARTLFVLITRTRTGSGERRLYAQLVERLPAKRASLYNFQPATQGLSRKRCKRRTCKPPAYTLVAVMRQPSAAMGLQCLPAN